MKCFMCSIPAYIFLLVQLRAKIYQNIAQDTLNKVKDQT